MGAISIFLARQKIRTITQFGPLPEIRVSLFDCIVLLFAAILFTAGILAIVRWQYAAPLAFAATIGLLIHFVPAVWDQMTGSYFFGDLVGHTIGTTWQMLLYQVVAMVSSAVLTYRLFHR